MKNLLKCLILLIIILTSLTFAFPWSDISNSNYQYKGPNHTAMYITGSGASSNLTNAPMGGVFSDVTNALIYYIIGATNGVCKFKPKEGVTSAQPLAVFAVNGAPKKIIIDGGKDCTAKLLYVYVDGSSVGDIKKVLVNGYGEVGKIAISNKSDFTGVTIQNVSKPSAGNEVAGNIHSVIVSGKLKKLQSNFGGIGGSSTNIGVVSVEAPSPKGQIKVGSKAEMSNLIFCGGLVNGGYDFDDAYNECLATQQVDLTVVKMGSIKKLKTKSIGPAIFGLQVEKKYKDASKPKITDVIGTENFVE